MVRAGRLFVFLPEPETWPQCTTAVSTDECAHSSAPQPCSPAALLSGVNSPSASAASPSPSSCAVGGSLLPSAIRRSSQSPSSAASRSPLKHGPVRALVVLEVQEYSFFHLGPTNVVDVDPHGAIAQHLGEDAVDRLRRRLRNPPKYPTFGDACGHVHTLLFGEMRFHMRAFEALVLPVSSSTPPWDPALVGSHESSKLWHGIQETSAFSPQLACCAVETCRDTQRSGLRVPLMMLLPFVPCEMDDRSAASTLANLMREGRHKVSPARRDRVEDGEIDDSSPGLPGVSKKRKHRASPKASDHRKMTAPGRLVFLSAHLDAREPDSGTGGHVHEVVDEEWQPRTGLTPLRVLKLRPLPAGPELTRVPDDDVVALDSEPNFSRAWVATLEADDRARKLSLFHGLAKHAERCAHQPLFGVLRTLVPGTPRAQAKAYVAEMEAALGPLQVVGGGAASSAAAPADE